MEEYAEYTKDYSGNKRLSNRLAKALQNMSKAPQSSISITCQNPYQAKSIYRILENEKFKMSS